MVESVHRLQGQVVVVVVVVVVPAAVVNDQTGPVVDPAVLRETICQK
jgi:hypothetical protein